MTKPKNRQNRKYLRRKRALERLKKGKGNAEDITILEERTAHDPGKVKTKKWRGVRREQRKGS